MAGSTETDHRSVALERSEPGVYVATNPRGGRLVFGSRAGDGFTPVELLLAAIGGCSALDVDVVTSRRAEPDRFEVTVEADKVTDEHGNHLQDIHMTFRLAFPDDDAGDQARARVPTAVRASHDKHCTVSRTIELGTPVAVTIDEP